jgi:hypothetical protein
MHQFDGTVQLYLADLQSGASLDIAMHDGEIVVVGPGLAFSGMSAIKIPVMVTFFRYKDDPPTPGEEQLLDGIFSDSFNQYTDLVLGLIGARTAGGGLVGANMVSDTAFELGLENTFLAGLLDTLGAITTPRVTPANSRTDLDLGPDPYNQTSAEDLGRMLVMIEACAKGSGRLLETYPGQVTAAECQRMLDILSKNEVGPIFVAGGSPGATVIHKHGWDLVPLNNAADAAIVQSDGGSYVMSVFVHRDEPVPFDDANRLIVSLARAVYNFYNPPT